MTTSSARLPTRAFWTDKRVLVTGHTGFKGSWLSAWLDELGAVTAGLSLPEAPTQPSLWELLDLPLALDVRADICSRDWKGAVTDFDPQIVLHLAAQPLVSEGFAAPYRTFETNVVGTAHLLDTIPEWTAVEAVLVATTDKVYDSTAPAPYDEHSRLGGKDPYSASKVGAELVVSSWPKLDCPIATARAGNVIGGGDWGRDRLIPDLVRSWTDGASAELRRPDAIRPWQHVLEPLGGYLVMVEELAGNPALPRSINFGPSTEMSVRVQEVVDFAAQEWAKTAAVPTPSWVVNAESPMPETENLAIDSTLALELLGWESRLDWQSAVTMTIDWYAEHVRGGDSSALLREQLRSYSQLRSDLTDDRL